METKLINLKVSEQIITPVEINIFNTSIFFIDISANKNDLNLFKIFVKFTRLQK